MHRVYLSDLSDSRTSREFHLMRIAIISPQASGTKTGNIVTARRWSKMLRANGYRVSIEPPDAKPDCDVIIGLHSGHSARAVLWFRDQFPDRPIIVGTVGTDLYRDMQKNKRAQECVRIADRLVILQPRAMDTIPKRYHKKCRVIYQSVAPVAKPPKPVEKHFEVVVVGHLRAVKDPFRAAMAVRSLPAESKIKVFHFGAALSDSFRVRAEKEMQTNPRYEWLEEQPRSKTLRRLSRSRLLVHSSKTEGGANVIGEAIVNGVPVLSSRIPGSIGLLGEDYCGYFETGDTVALRSLLLRAETDDDFLSQLTAGVKKRQPLFLPDRERETWADVLAELTGDKRGKVSLTDRKSDRKAERQAATVARDTTLTAANVRAALKPYIDPVKAAFYPSFFKAGKGEYAEGDQFIGVTVPNQRKVAKRFLALPQREVTKLLHDPVHEHRLTGLLILVGQYQKSRDEQKRSAIVDFYLSELDHVNNWDLVDASAHKILGDWLLTHDREVLRDLARSGHLWRERVSVIACLPLIKAGEFEEILELADHFLDHAHDLMHKAVGWMLREAGKQDESVLRGFLKQHAAIMPRTMLRYAIEKLPEEHRQRYLHAKKRN